MIYLPKTPCIHRTPCIHLVYTDPKFNDLPVYDPKFNDLPAQNTLYTQGWPGPYVNTVYDRIFGDFPAKKTYIRRIYMVLANPMYTPYKNSSGQS